MVFKLFVTLKNAGLQMTVNLLYIVSTSFFKVRGDFKPLSARHRFFKNRIAKELKYAPVHSSLCLLLILWVGFFTCLPSFKLITIKDRYFIVLY
jgi:hypothetical protein